jgi:hypothetical protein
MYWVLFMYSLAGFVIYTLLFSEILNLDCLSMIPAFVYVSVLLYEATLNA